MLLASWTDWPLRPSQIVISMTSPPVHPLSCGGRVSKARLIFLGSIGRPFLVVSTGVCVSPQMHVRGQPLVRA
jgi:hypothetical protein